MRIGIALGVFLTALGCAKSESRVVVYCAQDQEFANGVFADFQRDSGLAVAPKYDTEANKSVTLVAELLQEASRPRCDVHWNNEPLGTIRLRRAGVLEPYESPSAAAYPAWTRPSDKTYQAFAARARVLIVNTNLVPETSRPRSILDLTDPKWNGKVAMAKPLFGTTATHAACMFEALGPDKAKSFYKSLKANNVQIVAGNKQVAVCVAKGDFAVGMTDTDDALIELKAGKPVAVLFPDRDGMGTLFLPNTVALVKGGPNPAGAKKLIDRLLSTETEKRLAEAGGYQIPLNPQASAELPEPLKSATTAKRLDVDFEKVADRWDEVQTFLREEFAR